MQIPLLSGAYEGISTDTSSQELINWYFEKPAPREQHQGAVLPIPGGTRGPTVSDTYQITGMIYNSDPAYGEIYVVANTASGATLFQVDPDNTVTSRGTVGTFSTNPALCHMQLNVYSKEIYIKSASADRGWIYEYDSTTLTQITDTTPPTTSYASAFIDGYFLVSDNTGNNPGRFYWSNLNDGQNWDDTNFATATNLASDILDMVVDRGNIYLIGNSKSEIWYNSGNADQTFERFETLNTGCVTFGTAKQIDNTVMWFSQNDRGDYQVIRIGEGSVPQVVSTPELSYKWQAVATAHQPWAYVYQMGGHEFYVLSFRGTNTTWAYDASTGEWHQRSGTLSSGNPTEDFVSNHVFWPANTDDKHAVVLDSDPGHIYWWRPNEFQWTAGETTTAIPRRLTSPGIRVENEARIRISELQIDMQEALSGLTDADLVITWSKDGGRTFTSTGRTVDLEAGPRHMTRKCGYGRHWVFRLDTETDGKAIVKGAFARIAGEPLSG